VKGGIDMNAIAIERAATEEVVLNVLTHIKNGEIDDAIDLFAERFTFRDHGIGLEFKRKERLAEFFQKTRELFPDSYLEIDSILMSVDHVVSEWTLHTGVTEPFYGRLSRNIQVLLHGVSVVRTKNGKITDWSDYYDGLTSKRTALAAYFTDWVELWIMTAIEQGESLMNRLFEEIDGSRRRFLSMAAISLAAAKPRFVQSVAKSLVPSPPEVQSEGFFPGFSAETVETTGTKIHVLRKGSGRRLLLLHGYPETHLTWHKVAPKLAKQLRST
jgi:steroid delta-isomerase-like uncharacterized protein